MSGACNGNSDDEKRKEEKKRKEKKRDLGIEDGLLGSFNLRACIDGRGQYTTRACIAYSLGADGMLKTCVCIRAGSRVYSQVFYTDLCIFQNLS